MTEQIHQQFPSAHTAIDEATKLSGFAMAFGVLEITQSILEKKTDLTLTKQIWTTGIIVAIKK